MDQQQNTEAPHGAVPLDCSVRAQFEEWAKERGLIAVSHGIRSENSALGAYWEAWQAATKAEREDFARAMDVARLQGRLEAFAMAMTECSKATRHEDGSMGGRDCREIHTAIDILHLDTLRQMKTANARGKRHE